MPEVATEPVLAAAQRADIGSVGAAPTAFGGNARAAAEAERELATPIESAAPPGVATPGVATRGVATPGTSTLPPTPAAPPRRQPVRLRWWLLALGALWLIWITQRPTPARFDARVDKAIALAQACKANEAQSELIALKKTAATPAQLARLQTALDDADVACRRPARARSPARSTARSSSQSQSVRNLMSDARTSLARGDYRAAADKMEVCVAMVDANTRECSELKARAERLDGEMRRCLAQGGDWVGGICR